MVDCWRIAEVVRICPAGLRTLLDDHTVITLPNEQIMEVEFVTSSGDMNKVSSEEEYTPGLPKINMHIHF